MESLGTSQVKSGDELNWKGIRNRNGGAQQLEERKRRVGRNSRKARHDGGHDGFFMYRVSVAIFVIHALAWVERHQLDDLALEILHQ